ncbi:tetratricopeptide repeat protein [Xanthomarina spongicola]|uniref:Tetratricopeptide repeat protein n=1 Tax=Xanthomarina spongicola TaxID=570520 RepID=A0A316DRI3_9FLAO|nr:tetratricopeptide repeat protein [Xanthomarina spongicola]PWK20446.1 tetratricopeptide repeat protein [Xanthomarina spongicola]
MKKIIYIYIVFISTFSFAQNSSLFEQGNALYNEGDYDQAILKYEAILNNGEHSSELYFNLANAHYKLNHIAPSIYYYEKALQLDPTDKEIQNNLGFARNMTIDAIGSVPEVGLTNYLNNITNKLSFDFWAKTSVAFVCLFVLLFLFYYFAYSTTTKRLTFVSSMVCIGLTCITLLFAFHKDNLDKLNRPAIVFVQESQVKSEPNLRSTEAFILHEGTKVQILDTVNNWKKIKLSDGKTGWILNQDIKALNEI